MLAFDDGLLHLVHLVPLAPLSCSHSVNKFGESTSVCSACDPLRNKYSLWILYTDPLPKV